MTDGTPDNETTADHGPLLRLDFAALSDVGRVRKDNQDSGYAGPWLLTVCDGVGGAARGDIASATTVQQLRRIDARPGDDTLGLVAGALHRAHDRIGELVEEDPGLNGTSTTATVALFDGREIAVGHVGDSRAYLYRDGELTQLTKDHTFVQSLVDEGRITEEESRTHPHRNLILKAVDGVHDTEPDLFHVELTAGDRLFLCSDGACGVLDATHIADILATGNPDFAAVELVRASLEAGSTDNVTCIVADVLAEDADAPANPAPLLVGAAADLPRKSSGWSTMGGRFRGHRSGDTGELEPVPDEINAEVPWAIPTDPIDPEVARYAPRPPGRLTWLRLLGFFLLLIGLLLGVLGLGYAWTQRQYYVAEHDGKVTIFRGIDAKIPGIELSRPHEVSNVLLDRLSDYDAQMVREGIDTDSLEDARRTVRNYGGQLTECDPVEEPGPDATDPSDSSSAGAMAGENDAAGGVAALPSPSEPASPDEPTEPADVDPDCR
ncbi:protein phosphatase 2C domain-containing protein [Nocardioides sp. AE5]|uniref:PP2C family protein-serine/threonine phosphatase n=1 Tax=Nocardioides sp. AE5 TaxID=2962573 RepID=UPI00288205CE|nr:protein phosphatase 2C domain-containing protein [Nocardioides sp. AE5]MDT0202384.1 protein phosphatase 2C domain-containing protein [Nocardioides sp. AE5]